MVELLVVIAITGILLGLLFGPMIQGFNITRRTQAIASAQDAARFSLETITRELSQAAFIYDNTRAPVLLPIGTHENLDLTRPFLFARLDFVPSATENPAGTNGVLDPTTGGPLGGARLRFPAAPSARRVIRYWVGLRNNLPVNNNPAVYSNVYEFPRDGGTYNPFILWRAEYDPADTNLIRQGAGEFASGGFNDPNFFYNTAQAPNGKTYAENWREIASPLLSVDRVDLLAINRDSDGTITEANPVRTLVSFSPSSVVADTATPGYLTDTGNEIPNAVPSVYSAKYGQWTLPYTVTVYRHASRRNPTLTSANDPDYDPKAGSLRVRVSAEPLPGNPQQNVLVVRLLDSTGSLATTQTLNAGDLTQQNTADFAHAFSTRGGDLLQKSLFIKTRNLAFAIDPLQGRIQAGFPPLAATDQGLPLFDTNGDGQPDSLTAPFVGDPIPLVFRRSTLSDQAGQPVPGAPPGTLFPVNAGIRAADLTEARYFAPGNANTAYPSPFAAFSRALLVPGSERVLGPDDNPLNAGLVPYYRIPALSQLNKQSGSIEPVNPNDASDPYTKFTSFPAGALAYKLETDLDPTRPRVVFDDAIALTPPPQGLPAAMPNTNEPEKFVEISFLWQNNYARVVTDGPDLGEPVDAEGKSVAGRAAAPEADVVKVDYATRSLLNLSLGLRVYDATTGRPQTMQLSNKIKVNNAGR